MNQVKAFAHNTTQHNTTANPHPSLCAQISSSKTEAVQIILITMDLAALFRGRLIFQTMKILNQQLYVSRVKWNSRRRKNEVWKEQRESAMFLHDKIVVTGV